MMQPWQQARLEVNTRARNVQKHVNDQFVQNFETESDLARFKITQPLYRDTAAITALDYEHTAMLRVFTDLVYERMFSEEFRTRLGVILVHGLVAMQQHAWLCVEGDPLNVNADAERAARLERTFHISSAGLFRWRVIIDVCAPDIEPPCLLIAPTAPLMPQYVEQERFTSPIDYTETLERTQKEAVPELSDENRVLQALVNKYEA